ncbi:MAG: hypothetical protein CVT66_06455 [Actinobacteria bacterium HGW-Actinobacteria-6]|jgi:hypothetical protein|nr:MAG: hypothetical protein CVT66_06455 [Actinobacteria bacterium HGW-Actinobacteria-6]
MDNKLLAIALIVGTIIVSTVLQVFMQRRGLNPKGRRLSWIALAAGVVALVAVSIFVLGR